MQQTRRWKKRGQRKTRRHRKRFVTFFPKDLGIHTPKLIAPNTASDSEEEKPYKMFLFYASWCGHCHTTLPHWNKFETKANHSSLGKKVEIKKFESEEPESDSTKKQYGIDVDGYPTIVFVKNGKIIPYEGKRKWKQFMSFANHQANP
jgi:thiol-disulfide isomerase/thioredoxin